MKSVLATVTYWAIVIIVVLWVGIIWGCNQSDRIQPEYDSERSADITGDGCVNLADYYVLLSQWQDGCGYEGLVPMIRNQPGVVQITYQCPDGLYPITYTTYESDTNEGDTLCDINKKLIVGSEVLEIHEVTGKDYMFTAITND